MSSVLESVDWGKSALQLLKQLYNLDQSKPAIMHIRHSERQTLEENTPYEMAITLNGIQTSIEFGRKLTTERKYSILSTAIKRSKNTAEYIHKGIQEEGGKSRLDGIIPVTSVRDPIVHQRNMIQLHEGRSPEEAIRCFVFRWVSGFYPDSVLRPSLEFAQQAAMEMMNAMSKADSSEVVIWVSHDNWILPFLVHWIGEFNWDTIRFLDGFILQFYDDYMMLFFRGRTKKAEYPYWWGR